MGSRRNKAHAGGPRWYLADVVLEHAIEGDRRNVVHVNSHLIQARSADEAFRKARALGRRSQISYRNTDHKKVRLKFRGLRELEEIRDDLEDGVEVRYEESVGVRESTLRRWERPKSELASSRPAK